jgi:flagellar FliL protein
VSKTATAAVAATLPPAGAPAPAPNRKSKLLLVLVLLLLLGAAGGGAAWWFLGRAPAGAESKQDKAKPPVFQNLEPFTVNLAEENGDHYLQMSVVYQMGDEKAVEQLKTYLPIIRNRILLLLSSKRPSELATPEGKQKLVAELVAAARESIPGADAATVSGAYLGAFVIQ